VSSGEHFPTTVGKKPNATRGGKCPTKGYIKIVRGREKSGNGEKAERKQGGAQGHQVTRWYTNAGEKPANEREGKNREPKKKKKKKTKNKKHKNKKKPKQNNHKKKPKRQTKTGAEGSKKEECYNAPLEEKEDNETYYNISCEKTLDSPNRAGKGRRRERKTNRVSSGDWKH